MDEVIILGIGLVVALIAAIAAIGWTDDPWAEADTYNTIPEDFPSPPR